MANLINMVWWNLDARDVGESVFINQEGEDNVR